MKIHLSCRRQGDLRWYSNHDTPRDALATLDDGKWNDPHGGTFDATDVQALDDAAKGGGAAELRLGVDSRHPYGVSDVRVHVTR